MWSESHTYHRKEVCEWPWTYLCKICDGLYHLPPCRVLDQSILTWYPLFPAFKPEPRLHFGCFHGHQSSWFFAPVPIFVADHTCVSLFKYWCVLLMTCVRFLTRCRPTALWLDWVCCTFFLMTFCLSIGITFRVCIPVSTFIMPLMDLVVKPCPHFYIISMI